MKGIRIEEHGGRELLRVTDLPDPEPGPSEVRVRVRACGVNHLDVWVRKGVPGAKFPLPLILGSDIAGVVEGLGDGVSDLRDGDEVIVAPGVGCGVCRSCVGGKDHRCRAYGILGEHRDGGYADYVVAPRANILPKPTTVSFAQGASLGIPMLTAWHMLVDRAEIRPGETVLVRAAGSGVGSAAIQIAKLWGARIIATASTRAKLEQAESLGADHLLNDREEDVVKEVRRLTDGLGVEIVFEHVGEATWDTSLRCMGWHGRLVTCGATTGANVRVDLRHLFYKSLSVLGSTMGSKGELHDILRHVEHGALHPVVTRELPLTDCAEAHRLLEEREIFGKVVLIHE